MGPKNHGLFNKCSINFPEMDYTNGSRYLRVSKLVKSKDIQFGPVDALGNTARLVLLGSIDACQPRRRKSRSTLVTRLFWTVMLSTLGVVSWLILDGIRRGTIPTGLV